jgi:hypothetical protein
LYPVIVELHELHSLEKLGISVHAPFSYIHAFCCAPFMTSTMFPEELVISTRIIILDVPMFFAMNLYVPAEDPPVTSTVYCRLLAPATLAPPLVAVGVGVGVGVTEALEVGVGVAEALEVGVGVGVAVALEVGVGVTEGLGPTPPRVAK